MISIPPTDRRKRGREAETTAAAFLTGKGFTIIASNYQTRYGEIDLIGLDGPDLVFIEVKSRNARRSWPAEKVDLRKQRKLAKSADMYLASHEIASGGVRFDVVSMRRRGGEEWLIEHIKDAFRPEPQEY